MEALLGGKPLRLSLKGLDYMSDDPTDMHVLYLKVSDAVQRDKVQYSAVQSVHHSAAQYSTVQHGRAQADPDVASTQQHKPHAPTLYLVLRTYVTLSEQSVQVSAIAQTHHLPVPQTTG